MQSQTTRCATKFISLGPWVDECGVVFLIVTLGILQRRGTLCHTVFHTRGCVRVRRHQYISQRIPAKCNDDPGNDSVIYFIRCWAAVHLPKRFGLCVYTMPASVMYQDVWVVSFLGVLVCSYLTTIISRVYFEIFTSIFAVIEHELGNALLRLIARGSN